MLNKNAVPLERTAFVGQEKYHLISGAMLELLHGLPPITQKILEAASVYRHFNEERLNVIMEDALDTESFRKFVALPFVFLKPEGWVLHDAVRAWALEDFQLRKPNGYEQMRRKALQQIRKEEQTSPHLKQKLYIDKMTLHEHPVVRSICFSGYVEDGIEVRLCRESDLSAMCDLYTQFHRFSMPEVSEDPPLGKLMEDIYRIAPASFITMWQRERLIAFFGKIPLQDRILEVLQREVLLQPFLLSWKPIPNAYLVTYIGIAPELEEKTRAYIINTLINHFSYSEWILDFTCLKEWFPVFELCGFEPAPWADAKTVLGTEYRAFVLDLTQEDFITKLDRSVSRQYGTGAVTPAPKAVLSEMNELKTILKHWGNIPRKPDLQNAYARLFPHRLNNGLLMEQAGLEIQKQIEEAIHRLEEGDETEEMLGKLLSNTYLKRLRPHERVAKALNISLATYYRHLQKALDALYYSLIRM